MKNKEQIDQLFNYVKSISSSDFILQEDVVQAAYQQQKESHSLIIKLLIILGGMLTSIFGTAFFLLIGLYDSSVAMMITGALCIVIPAFLTTKTHEIFLDTLLLSTFCIGFCLLGAGMYSELQDYTVVSILFLAISILILLYIDNYIIVFVSVLICLGSLYSLLLINDLYYLQTLFISGTTILTTWIFLQESRILTSIKLIARIYEPAKIAVLLFCLYFLSTSTSNLFYMYFDDDHQGNIALLLSSPIVNSLIIYVLLYFVMSRIFTVLEVTSKKHQIGCYALTLLVLIPTSFQPNIAGSILLILLCFLVNYKTGFILSILAFLYFITRFYYDMEINLLYKSIALISSGILFFIVYFITSKKLTTHEEV